MKEREGKERRKKMQEVGSQGGEGWERKEEA